MAGLLKYSKMLTKTFLIKQYNKNKKSMPQIAKEVGCSRPTIKNYLVRYNLLVRNSKESINLLDKTKHRCSWKGNLAVKRKRYYCIESDCSNEICYCNWIYGTKRCLSCAVKEQHRNNVFNYNRFPNKPEKLLIRFLGKLLPKEYKYVGDWSCVINGLCPDFVNVNGQKKVIELYGDYWHRNTQKNDKVRIKRFTNYGYKTLIIWERELKDLNKVKEKILEFHCGRIIQGKSTKN